MDDKDKKYVEWYEKAQDITENFCEYLTTKKHTIKKQYVQSYLSYFKMSELNQANLIIDEKYNFTICTAMFECPAPYRVCLAQLPFTKDITNEFWTTENYFKTNNEFDFSRLYDELVRFINPKIEENQNTTGYQQLSIFDF